MIEVDPSIPDPEPIGRPRGARTVGISPSSVPGSNQDVASANARAAATLGVHSELPTVMPFSSTLAFAFRHIGGVAAAIEAARLVSEKDERFKRVVYAWDQVSETDRSKLKLEALCEAAEIPAADFLGTVVAAIYTRNTDIAKLIAAANHPKVVEATIENAQTRNGFMDRKMLHDHMGFLPLPKGMNINIDNSKKTLVAGGQPEGSRPGAVEDLSKTALPSFEDETMESTRAIRGDAGVGSVGQKRLAPPRPEQAVTVPEILDAEPVEEPLV